MTVGPGRQLEGLPPAQDLPQGKPAEIVRKDSKGGLLSDRNTPLGGLLQKVLQLPDENRPQYPPRQLGNKPSIEGLQVLRSELFYA